MCLWGGTSSTAGRFQVTGHKHLAAVDCERTDYISRGDAGGLSRISDNDKLVHQHKAEKPRGGNKLLGLEAQEEDEE